MTIFHHEKKTFLDMQSPVIPNILQSVLPRNTDDLTTEEFLQHVSRAHSQAASWLGGPHSITPKLKKNPRALIKH